MTAESALVELEEAIPSDAHMASRLDAFGELPYWRRVDKRGFQVAAGDEVMDGVPRNGEEFGDLTHFHQHRNRFLFREGEGRHGLLYVCITRSA